MNKLKKLLYIFQLEGYEVERFRKWLIENRKTEIVEVKQQIKWTLKAKILYFLCFIPDYITFHQITAEIIIFFSQVISIPEKIVKYLIIQYAKFKIGQRKDLIVIGITGSYGKTSVKEILAHILSAKYKVLKTPDSVNTPLGISRVILNNLKKEHQILIVEMGAYQIGDIKKLCEIVHPTIGVITAIGLQHLERFGSEENIAQTKFELVDSLPKKGMAFLNIEDKIIYENSKKYPKKIITYYGFCDILPRNIDKQYENSLIAGDIETSIKGTSFKLYKNNEKTQNITTPLLGTHNVLNILVSASIAYYLRMKLADIAKQCSTLEVIPHRLQILKGESDTTIIDDSFNANPDSFRSALKVMGEISGSRKIIITPGVIELGERQAEENRLLGEEMAKTADYVIVVGETNRKAILTGLSNIQQYCVKNLNEATEKLKEIMIPDSVILFENDLPDQYK